MKEREIVITAAGGGTSFPVRLHPRAGRNRVIGVDGGRLKIAVAAAPVNNQANRALVQLLRREFKVPQNAITILRGASSRDKLIHIRGLTEEGMLDYFRSLT